MTASAEIQTPQEAAPARICANCGATVLGTYCHICGQKDDDLRRPIWTFLQHFVDDVFSLESRLLRTIISLLFLPGLMTRRYVAGRRQIYSPPLRLYLVTSLLFFFTLSATQVVLMGFTVVAKAPEVSTGDEIEQEDAVGAYVSGFAEGFLSGVEAKRDGGERAAREQTGKGDDLLDDTVEGSLNRAEEKRDQEVRDDQAEADGNTQQPAHDPLTAEEVDPGSREIAVTDDATVTIKRVAIGGEELSEEEVDELETFINTFKFALEECDVSLHSFEVRVQLDSNDQGCVRSFREAVDKNDITDQTWFLKRFALGFSRALEEPEAMNRAFNIWVPRAMMILLPMMAIYLRMVHWRKGQHLFNHIVFSLHFHTFIFGVMIIMLLWARFIGPLPSSSWVIGLAALYLLIAMKLAYRQGWVKTVFKFLFVGIAHGMLVSFAVLFLSMAAIWDA